MITPRTPKLQKLHGYGFAALAIGLLALGLMIFVSAFIRMAGDLGIQVPAIRPINIPAIKALAFFGFGAMGVGVLFLMASLAIDIFKTPD